METGRPDPGPLPSAGPIVPGNAALDVSSLRPLESPPPSIPDYELLRCIGRGSYGDVWLARNVLGQLRAVKFIYRNRFHEARPFEREFHGIQHFEPISRSHPSQLHILHVGKNDTVGCFYYVMELADALPPANEQISGSASEAQPSPSAPKRTLADSPAHDSYSPRTLRSELECNGRLPIPACIEIGHSLATALGHLHEQGLVHRDIKPSNIIFVNDVAKLGDIGLVTGAGDTQSIVGTEGYLPPEGPGTPQADLYSLGKVLYEISTGMDRRRFAELPDDVWTWPDSRAIIEFNEIVLKACAKDPAQRYQNAEQLRADFELLQEGKSVQRTRRNQRLWSRVNNVALGLVLLALVAAGVARMGRQTQRSETSSDGPPSTNELANALCVKALLNLRADNFGAFPATYTNLHLALKLDPNCYRAYVGLLELRAVEVVPEIGGQTLEEMRSIASKLEELGPNLAPTFVAQALVKWSEWDYPASKQFAHRATQVDPDYGFARLTYGFLLTQWGLTEEGRKELETARRLVPSKVTLYRFLGHPYFVERRFTNAIAIYQQALAWESHHMVAFHFIGSAYIAMNNYSNGIPYLEKRALAGGMEATEVTRRFDALRRAWQDAGPRGYWQEQWNQVGSEQYYWKGAVQLHLSNTNAAFYWLNKSFETREQSSAFDGPLNYLIFDFVWDGVRGDPRFQELLDKVGFTKVNPKLKQ